MLTHEQWQQWRNHCYIESEIDLLLADPVRSVVVSTYSGCGLSTSLAMLQASRLLLLNYNPEEWAGTPQAFGRSETHFGQWMARFADSVMERLTLEPDDLARLNLYQQQLLLWLLERYLGKRQSRFWQGELERLLPVASKEELTQILADEPIDYGDTVADMKYQINECVAIARRLGWEGVFATVDLRWWDWLEGDDEERAQLEVGLRKLLTTLAPLEVPHFGVKLGIPARLLPPQDIDRLTRSRIRPMLYPTTYRWTVQQLQQICQRQVTLAAKDADVDFAPPPTELWRWLEADIARIWEYPCPAAASVLARIWCEFAAQRLAADQLVQQLRVSLYRHAAPLRCDSRPGSQIVYRGQQPIHLDDMPFRIFTTLWQHRGSPASNETLLGVAGSKANLDKLISRLREQLEPMHGSGTTIYLQRRPNGGAWIDAAVAAFDI